MSEVPVAKSDGELPRDVLAAPEYGVLRELRRTFARKGHPPAAEGSAEHQARGAAYTTIAELLRVLAGFRERIARGEAVRLVVPEQKSEAGRMRVEIAIIEEERA